MAAGGGTQARAQPARPPRAARCLPRPLPLPRHAEGPRGRHLAAKRRRREGDREELPPLRAAGLPPRPLLDPGGSPPRPRRGERSRGPGTGHEVARRPLRAGGEPGAPKERARAARALSPPGLEDAQGGAERAPLRAAQRPAPLGEAEPGARPSRARCASIPRPQRAGSTAGGASASGPPMHAPWTRLRYARRTRGCWAWGGEGSACSTPRRCRASWRAARPSDVGRNRPRRASFVTNLRRPALPRTSAPPRRPSAPRS